MLWLGVQFGRLLHFNGLKNECLYRSSFYGDILKTWLLVHAAVLKILPVKSLVNILAQMDLPWFLGVK